MNRKTDFKNRYPISSTDAVYYPFIYKIFWGSAVILPDVKLRCILNFGLYAGYKEGAVRTAVSRLKKNGTLISAGDRKNPVYILNEDSQMRTMHIKNDTIQQGFTLAIFSFYRENEKERYIIRSILTKEGFKKLAQNTYINIQGRKERLIRKIENEGLEKHLYIFECDDELDDNTILRLTDVWKIKERIKSLNEFFSDLKKFILPEGLSEKEIFHMLGYAGTAYFSKFHSTEPPLPTKYLPHDYPLRNIYNFLVEINSDYLNVTKKYFKKVNG
jgi:DNA-binding transcriptional regulator PaaX